MDMWSMIQIIKSPKAKVSSILKMEKRSSLKEKLNHINKCDICVCQYDRHDKQPITICSMHHTICRECLYNLKATKMCPYCRERIDFDKVVVNNYILELLPEDPPNIRADQIQMSDIRPIPPPQNPQPPIYIPPGDPVINYIPPGRQHYNGRLHNRGRQGHRGRLNNHIFIENQLNRSFFSRMFERLQFNKRGWALVHIFIFILQLPFLCLDLYFGLAGKDEACLDTPYEGYVLRPWLMLMAKTQLLIMGIASVGVLLRLCLLIPISCLKVIEIFAVIVLGIKIFVWGGLHPNFYKHVISPHCSGGMYVYGYIQNVFYYILLILMVIAGMK